MDNFFEKLMLARQALFNDGNIKLFGVRSALAGNFLGVYTEKINDDQEIVKMLYKDSKIASYDFYSKMGKSYSFSPADYLKWIVDLTKFGGWGIVSWKELDKDSKKGVITVQDPPTGSYLKGKVTSPCDHVIRGFIAGNAKCAFGVEMDAVETECVAMGKSECVIVVEPTGDLRTKFPGLFNSQIY